MHGLLFLPVPFFPFLKPSWSYCILAVMARIFSLAFPIPTRRSMSLSGLEEPGFAIRRRTVLLTICSIVASFCLSISILSRFDMAE